MRSSAAETNYLCASSFLPHRTQKLVETYLPLPSSLRSLPFVHTSPTCLYNRNEDLKFWNVVPTIIGPTVKQRCLPKLRKNEQNALKYLLYFTDRQGGTDGRTGSFFFVCLSFFSLSFFSKFYDAR